ncbi:DEAD/DEAH box helicase [uncultured Muribaculum sp.]|uniref:DEAD/DEAH box helicase n=1 Tax=uncultured Muribaculum sp. TaxID=1918613 RepID=UPI0025D312C7|nr:DEAD/DEAH box helicase [uncultured Muribaculum sp.]
MELQEILAAIRTRMGINKLNPMQEAAISSPSSDVVILSPTGSGKTLAFTAMMLSTLQKPYGEIQGVVVAPSRELVMQIFRIVRELASGYKVVALYGGHSMIDEKNSLSPMPDIVVATPGRLLDHVMRKQIDLYTTRVLVLDEYDKSLELGFHDEMKKLLRVMPRRERTILTSATRLTDIPEFLKLGQTATIDCLEKSADLRSRMQIVEVESPSKDKLDTLTDLMRSLPDGRVIIFVNHRESADRVYRHLKGAGLPVGLYHGALEQNDREKAVDLLNNGSTPVLVSTDLGARGLDIDSVSAIVHYHMPLSQETWTHRNGRTARVDATGTVYVLASESDTIPDYIVFDRSYSPTGHSDNPIRASAETLYFNAGKKEKISKGDIAGFIIKQGGVDPAGVGRIVVRDHNAIAAVPAGMADGLAVRLSAQKLKGKKVRVSVMR